MAKRINSEEIDHMHAHYATHPALAAYIISHLTNIPYSLTIHSHDIYDNHVMLKQKLGKAKFIVTISEYNIEYLKKLLGPEIEEKTTVIHCGVDIDRFNSSPDMGRKDNEKFEVLQIGSLHWKKGQTYLLEAIKLIKDKIPNLAVTIIGEGPERTRIERKIEELELRETVTLMGAQPQHVVQKILPTADCYVQTSLSEGIPVAIMEALACKLPVIATNITGIPEIIHHKKTGLLIPPKDPQATADAILFISNNRNLGKRYGQNGRRLVEKEFNLSKNVTDLTTTFSNSIG